MLKTNRSLIAWRPAAGFGQRLALFVAKWLAAGVLAAIGFILFLLALAEPLSPMKPTAQAKPSACAPIHRST